MKVYGDDDDDDDDDDDNSDDVETVIHPDSQLSFPLSFHSSEIESNLESEKN